MAKGRYRPALASAGLLHAVPYDDAAARERPAAEALELDPGAATASVVSLTGGHEDWTVRGRRRSRGDNCDPG